MGKYFAAQECVVEMYIYLGGSDAFVSQHLLYSPQVGSAFEVAKLWRKVWGLMFF